jgi:hypothetical protein
VVVIELVVDPPLDFEGALPTSEAGGGGWTGEADRGWGGDKGVMMLPVAAEKSIDMGIIRGREGLLLVESE